jgi:sulfoxide reductase heme-binding subunit YedZ
MNRPRINSLRIAVHLAAAGLLVWLLVDYYTGGLGVNPIQAAIQRTGRYAISLLVLSLACTPLYNLFGWRQALTVRRALGLYAFLYAALHMLLLVGVDYRFDWATLFGELFPKRYILVGISTLVILTVLAVTSFKWWMKRLGKNWKRLHRLVYLAGALAVVHYAWALKGDILRLQGDINLPLVYGLVLALLLIVRIPPVRRALTLRRAIMGREKPAQ